MSKIALMDKQLDAYKNIASSEICTIVNSLFKINLEEAPILIKQDTVLAEGSIQKSLIDQYLQQFNDKVSGQEVRQIINEIFGINLNAIASLEGTRISLYSKNQWVLRAENDLIVVYTGDNDIDVKIYPTEYYISKKGTALLPTELQQSLLDFGYTYNANTGEFYYANPLGDPVEDSFKGKTMKSIIDVIQQSLVHL